MHIEVTSVTDGVARVTMDHLDYVRTHDWSTHDPAFQRFLESAWAMVKGSNGQDTRLS